MTDFFRNKSWGFWIAAISVVAAWIVVAFRVPYGGHYFSFTMPSHALWSGADPYGVDFAGAHGHFHYSPSCALFFFGLFAFFPPLIGRSLYLLVEIVLFTYALSRMLGAMKTSVGFDVKKAVWHNLFWLMYSSELVGAILTHKMEITIAALEMLALSVLLQGGSSVVAGALLGIGIAFNLQPLPVAGLASVVLLITKRDWKFPAAVLGSAALVTLAALPVLGWGMFAHVIQQWVVTTEKFSSEAWLAFHHVYHFILYWFGSVPEFHVATRISAAVGVTFAVFLGWWTWTARLPEKLKTPFGLVAAWGIGAAFCVSFFPLSQSNAYTMYTPLIPAVWIFSRFLPLPGWGFGCIALTAYSITSIFYSDLVPKGFYRWAYDSGLKPIGVLLLLATLFWAMIRSRRLTRVPAQ